jgi:hypothetical protein
VAGVVVPNDYSLGDIKQFTRAYFRDTLKEKGDTGRVFESQYFRPNMTKGKLESPRSEDNVRARAKIRIIGNERPYSIQTQVEVETLENGQWVNRGVDDQLTDKLSRQLVDYIRTRQNKNDIDRYRAF